MQVSGGGHYRRGPRASRGTTTSSGTSTGIMSWILRIFLSHVFLGCTITTITSSSSSLVSPVTAYPTSFPPLALPNDGLFQLKSCVGVSRTLNAKGPLALLFLDADSDFSRTQYRHFAQLAKIFPEIHFVAILSFGLGWDSSSCSKIPQPEGSPASLLLDQRNFYGTQYAFEFFSVSPNELVLYNEKRRFRYLPKTQADMSRPIGHTWVHTAIEELDRVITNPTRFDAAFMTKEFVQYPSTMIEDGEIGRINAASSQTRCEEKCVQIGCTGFVMYGSHHCTFFAGETGALMENRLSYGNASLFVRRPLADVNKSQKILKGFLWAAVIILSASMLFFVCQKMGSKKTHANVLDSLEQATNTGLSSLIRAAEQDEGVEEEKFTNIDMSSAADMSKDDPAE
ncbi:unnamed protein product [Amoebophrya sp. A120]|nr:unnamed protein product [Amoebophrya sp. A120]|eukprot:GSA120T00016068001.1